MPDANVAPDPSATPDARLHRLIAGARDTQLIYIAAKAGLVAALAAGPRSAAELAATIDAHPAVLPRVLRGLVMLEVLREEDGRFALTDVGARLRPDAPGSLHDTAILWGEMYAPAWPGLLHGLTTGQPIFEHIFGIDAWEYRARHPVLAEAFNRRMTLLTEQVAAAVLAAYDFAGIRTLVDVAGGHGALIAALLTAHPHLRAMLFDAAPVVDGARAQLTAAGLVTRCTFVAGDFFVAVPPGGDCYVLKNIIHDWDDEQSVAILRSCRAAMAAASRLLVIEGILPERGQPSAALVTMDLNMLAIERGRERTAGEHRALLDAAGLRLVRVVPTAAPVSILEAAPAQVDRAVRAPRRA